MYRHCLSCSADLGQNEVAEAFPVGRRLAFDAWKGRLWVVCPRCRRWNLAALEERWEPVESLEKLFRQTRTRVQSEHIGLARLGDGTALIRVGEALPGELAAWRYGEELLRRRWKALFLGASAGAVAVGVGLGGLGGLVAVGIPAGLGNTVLQALVLTHRYRSRRQLLQRLPAGASPTGEPLEIRREHLDGAVLSQGDEGRPRLWLPALTALDMRPPLFRSLNTHRLGIAQLVRDGVVSLEGEAATRVAGRGLVSVNARGASRGQVRDALRVLEMAGGAEGFVHDLAARDLLLVPAGRGLVRERVYRLPHHAELRLAENLPDAVRRHALGRGGRSPNGLQSLALEMALHEERERRALEGELAALEDEWREAEMLARIADALPGEPPPDEAAVAGALDAVGGAASTTAARAAGSVRQELRGGGQQVARGVEERE